ncbi:MAG: hypothetical protein WCG78_06945, partial [Candidatus Omnitrophota bacterium]
MSLSFKEALSVALIEKKLLTRARLDEALAIQKEAGGDLRDILVRQGFIDSDNLVALASQELGIPLINLSRFKMDPDVIKLIPRDIAAKYHLIPLSRLEEVLTVVIEDPLNLFVLDQITILSSFKIIPVIAAAQEVRAAIDNYYPESAYEELEKIAAGVSSTKVEVLD